MIIENKTDGGGTPVINININMVDFYDRPKTFLHINFVLLSKIFWWCLFRIIAESPDNNVGINIVTIMVFIALDEICLFSLKVGLNVAHIMLSHFPNLICTFF